MYKVTVPQVGAVWYDNNKRGRALFRRAGKHTALLQMDTPGHFPGNGGFFMRGAVKKLAASLALACLLACAALGAQSVPGAVLDARQSTVRVLAVSGGNVSSGTGFAVARNSRYVVTNYHVVEGYEEFEVYLSHEAAVPATVKAAAPGADLAVLETAAPLKVPGLALRTSGFDTGLAVWALGFPGGADTLAGQPAAGVDEMTVTDGIVSAVKTSHEVGTASQAVRLVQTNAAINHGNSGGPMVDEKGNVVGVNTVGVENVQAINGAVHVSELINVLEANAIPYKTQSRMGAVLGAAALALCAATAALGLRIWKKKGWPHGAWQQAVPLVRFVQAGRRLAPADAAAAVAAAVQAKGVKAHGLCAPQCVLVRGSGVELVKKKGADYRAPGYTAPETYYGVQGEAGSVYFYGAVLYALTEGAVPPDIPSRMNGAPLAFCEQNPLRFFIENAMDMQAGRRTQSLAQFAEELAALAARLSAAPQARAPVQACAPAAVLAQAGAGPRPEAETAPFAAAAPAHPAPLPAQEKPKKRRRRKWVAAAVAAAVLAVPVGFGIYTWRQADALETAVSYGQYGQAQAAYRRAPWLRLLDEQQAAYVDAQTLMAQGELEQAKKAFLALEDYLDSSELEHNLERYLYAESMTAVYSKYRSFYDLGDFLDAREKAFDCLPELYDTAMQQYEENIYFSTANYFEILMQYPGYEDAELYKIACDVQQKIDRLLRSESAYTAEISNTLRWLEQYIDIENIATSNMWAFMRGQWYANSGNYMDIPIEGNFYTSFYLPTASYYFLTDGMEHAGNGEYYATWEYVNFDTLYVTVNGRSEYYYRAV